jgi:hypothetical protein
MCATTQNGAGPGFKVLAIRERPIVGQTSVDPVEGGAFGAVAEDVGYATSSAPRSTIARLNIWEFVEVSGETPGISRRHC